jgi:hypothetical protein
MAERLPRAGTTFQIGVEKLFPANAPNAITAAVLHLRDSAGVAISGSPFTATVTPVTVNRKYWVFYNLDTTGLSGLYDGFFRHTASSPGVDDDTVEGFYVWPVPSKYDRWVQRVRRGLQDHAGSETQNVLSDLSYMDAINAAVAAYSQHRPKVVEWEQALTANDWTYALPAGWITGYSQIIRPEYPYDATLQGRTYLLPADLDVDEADSILFLVNHTPSTGETFRFLYLGLPTLSHSTDNLPSVHFEAVAKYAIGEALETLANHRAGQSDPFYEGGVVSYGGQSLRFQAQADKMKAQAREMWRDRRVYV